MVAVRDPADRDKPVPGTYTGKPWLGNMTVHYFHPYMSNLKKRIALAGATLAKVQILHSKED
jgi:hypothetical protein